MEISAGNVFSVAVDDLAILLVFLLVSRCRNCFCLLAWWEELWH